MSEGKGSFFSGIMSIGERRLLREIAGLAEMGMRAALEIEGVLNQKDSCGGAEKIRKIEKEADEIYLSASTYLAMGQITTSLSESFSESIELADNITDLYLGISREMLRLSAAEPHYRESSIFELLMEMQRLCRKSIEALVHMLNSENLEDMRAYRNEIHLMEEKGDEIKDTAIDRLYREADVRGYSDFYLMFAVIHKFDDILDCCEDLSDRTIFIVSSISK